MFFYIHQLKIFFFQKNCLYFKAKLSEVPNKILTFQFYIIFIQQYLW